MRDRSPRPRRPSRLGHLCVLAIAALTTQACTSSGGDAARSDTNIAVRAPMTCTVAGCVGEGINTATGSFLTETEDVVFPPGLFGVELLRVYRSDETTRRWFGRGWSTVYETKIVAAGSSFTVDAPAGLHPVWTPEAPSGWHVVGDPSVRAVEAGYVLSWPSGEEWMFNSSGDLAALASPYGASVRVERSPDTVTIASTQGASVDLAVSDGRVVAAELSDGRRVEYSYVDDLLTEVTAPGALFVYRYDQDGHMIEASAPAGSTSVTYRDGKVATQRSATGARFSVSYDGATTTVLTAGIDTSYVHDDAGRLTGVVRDGQDVVTLSYDSEGRLTDRTEFALPGGEIVSQLEREYSGVRLVSQVENGIESKFSYDDSGRITEITGPEAASFEYVDDEPLPSAVSTPQRGRSEIEVEVGFIVGIEDATGAVMRTTRDQLGNALATGRPGAMWTYGFDAEGNVTSTTAPSGRTWTAQWGPRGALLQERDPLGRTTIYRFDDAGRPVEALLHGGRSTERAYTPSGLLAIVTGSDGEVSRYEYDTDGRLATIVQPGDRTWRLRYDVSPDGSQTITLTGPDGVSTVTTLDSSGRETERRALEADGSLTERVTTTYEYDRLVETVTRRGSSELVVKTSYDDAGRVVSVESALDGQTGAADEYEYSDGRLAEARSGADSVAYEYDSSGRLRTVTSGNDTWTADYVGGVLAQTSHNDEATQVEYDIDGRPVAFFEPNGVTTRWEYDDADRPTARSVANAHARFTWGASDQLEQYRASTGATWTWEYDRAGRVTRALEPDGIETVYEYEFGAVTQITTHGGERDRPDKYTYDSRGLLRRAQTNGGTFEYVYDATDRMIRVDSSDRGDEAWTLDAAGRVVAVQTGDDRYDVDYTEDGQVDAVRGPDDRVLDVKWDAGSLRSVEVDGHDAMSIALDEDGRLRSVVWDKDTSVEVTWHDETFTVAEPDENRSAQYTVHDGRLTGYVTNAQSYRATYQNNGYLASLAIESDDISGQMMFDHLGRPDQLRSNELTSSITYNDGDDGRVHNVTTTQLGKDPEHTVVTYDSDGRHIDGEDDLVEALFDSDGALRESLPSGLPNPLSAGSDGAHLHGVLAADGLGTLLDPQPQPFAQVEAAITSVTPQVTSPIGVRDRVRLARQLIVAEVDRLSPVVSVNSAVSMHVPIVSPDGRMADFNPFTDAIPSGRAIGTLARLAGDGGSLLDRAIENASSIIGGVVSVSADIARFVVINPVARLVLSTASVVAAGVACAPTSGLACAPLAAVAVGLVAGDATITLANAVPTLLSDCPAGHLASCGINVAHAALAGTQLLLAGNIAAALVRIADRAVVEAAAEGAAAALASGESGVARSELLVALRGSRIVAREVPACVDDVCARFDLVVRRLNGRLVPVEVKNGSAARFTINQTKIYPMLDTTAAYLPNGLLNGGSPEILLVGRPVVHHWNTPLPLQLP